MTVIASMPWSEVFGAGAFFLAGMVGSVAGAVALCKPCATKGWPTVAGTVMGSGVEAVSEEGYYPRVLYRYSIEGRLLDGSRLQVIDRSYTFKSSAKAVASRYEVGRQIVVWVNPADPAEAVLQPGPQPLRSVFLMCAGALFVGPGLRLFIHLLRVG